MRGFTTFAAVCALGLASAASAALFTIDDPAGDGIFDPGANGGIDLLDISMCGTSGVNITVACPSGEVDAVIRGVDLTTISVLDINPLFSAGTVDWPNQDVLIIDIELYSPSAPIDQIGFGVPAAGIFTNPVGAGVLLGAGVLPDAAPTFNGFGLWVFDFTGVNQLDAGEISVRLFTTFDPQGVLEIGQLGSFMISSGTDENFSTPIIPEPSTGLLLGVGLAAVAGARRRSRS